MKRKRKITTLGVCILFGLILWPLGAQAALITIQIEAVVDSVDDPFGYLEGNITPGDIITGSYTYDLSTPDTNPSLHVGDYEHWAPPGGISLTVGGFEFKSDPGNLDFLIEIIDDSSSGGLHDSYILGSYGNLPLADGTFVGGIWWYLKDSTASALSSIALPINAPVLDDWGFNRLSLGGGTRARPFGIMGHVTSAIPEPATIVLFGLGGLLLGRRR
jgi:hypothetical protein